MFIIYCLCYKNFKQESYPLSPFSGRRAEGRGRNHIRTGTVTNGLESLESLNYNFRSQT